VIDRAEETDEKTEAVLVQEWATLGESAQDFMGALGRTADEAKRVVEDQLQVRPYVVLGAAVGLGYILGGGVPSFLTRTVFTLGMRSAVSYAVGQLVNQLTTSPERA
jgi:hypothetical protein